MSFVTYEAQGGTGLLTLNRPARLNAINGDLLADFERCLVQAMADPDTAAVVLTGAGRAFCSGDDLAEFSEQSADQQAARAHIGAIQRITKLMLGGGKLIIGAMHGYAVGGGFEWLLNCDMVVASDTLIAFFPEMGWGAFVTGGVTYLLPRSIGYQRAMELFVLGERQSAERLLQLGVVNWVVPQDQMLAKALCVAEAVGKKSRTTVARLKVILNKDLAADLWRAVEIEEAATIEAFMDPEAAKRVRSFATRR